MENLLFNVSDLTSLLLGVIFVDHKNSGNHNVPPPSSSFVSLITEDDGSSNDIFSQIAGLYFVIIVFFAAASLSIYVKSFVQERAYRRRNAVAPAKMFDLDELLRPKKKKLGNSKSSKKSFSNIIDLFGDQISDPGLVKSKIIESGPILLRTDSSSSVKSTMSSKSSISSNSSKSNIIKSMNRGGGGMTAVAYEESSKDVSVSNSGEDVNGGGCCDDQEEMNNQANTISAQLETKFYSRVDTLEQQQQTLRQRPSSSKDLVGDSSFTGVANQRLSEIESKYMSLNNGMRHPSPSLAQEEQDKVDGESSATRYSQNYHGRLNKKYSNDNNKFVEEESASRTNYDSHSNFNNNWRNNNLYVNSSSSQHHHYQRGNNNRQNMRLQKTAYKGSFPQNNEGDHSNTSSTMAGLLSGGGKRDFKGTGKLFYDATYNKEILNIDLNLKQAAAGHEKNNVVNGDVIRQRKNYNNNNMLQPLKKYQNQPLRHRNQQKQHQQHEQLIGPYIRRDGVLMLVKSSKVNTATDRVVEIDASSSSSPQTTTSVTPSAAEQLKSALSGFQKSHDQDSFHQVGGLVNAADEVCESVYASSGSSNVHQKQQQPIRHRHHHQQKQQYLFPPQHLAAAMEPGFASSSPSLLSTPARVVPDAAVMAAANMLGSKILMSMLNVEGKNDNDVLVRSTRSDAAAATSTSQPIMIVNRSGGGGDGHSSSFSPSSSSSVAYEDHLMSSSPPLIHGVGGNGGNGALTHRNRGFLLLDP